MLDNRKALKCGFRLELNTEQICIIDEEIGRGAASIVYGGHYLDSMGQCHCVRIKECYPCWTAVNRLDDGKLSEAEDNRSFEKNKGFGRAKERFIKAYQRNVELQNTLGLVNSTVNASDLYETNGTWYVVMGMIEGCDYRKNVDKDMQSVFIRMKALAQIILKYHDIGFLHLDIKPENILVIPETREHMILFDFDSLRTRNEIVKSDEEILFSHGFAAPEVAQGKREKIGPEADVYGIGALIFWKLFGKTPDAMDGGMRTEYDFTQLLFRDVRYQVQLELLRKLEEFFHRTIATSVSYRYGRMENVIADLEKLILLSDIDAADLVQNFSYFSSCFVGREQELEMMEAVLMENRVLFLAGIGGIGKTELAKRYAFLHQREFRKIVFLPFQKSVRETVCGGDLIIRGVEQRDNESQNAFYFRKLTMLKEAARENDLIILDNFDVSWDEDLEDFFSCSCQFLITTRENGFRDLNFCQMNVGRIHSMNALMEIFQHYNCCEYPQPQQKYIQEMLCWIDCHTLTVELLAKYLRDTGNLPEELFKRLKTKEGIFNTGQTRVCLRKDKKVQGKSINQHLAALFDVSEFSEEEKEILRSLSLLGYVRIEKDAFLNLCCLPNGGQALKTLIRRGWIEYDRQSHKISFHQIILDLVYFELAPSSENCPHITMEFCQYMKKEFTLQWERRLRKRLAENFMERIRGNNLLYARLCLEYCSRVKYREEYMDQAEKICLENMEKERGDVLQRICRCKIRQTCRWRTWMDDLMQEEGKESGFEHSSREICRLARKAYAYAKQYSREPDYLGRFCGEISRELAQTAAEIGPLMAEDGHECEAMDRILDLAVSFIEDGEEYIKSSHLEKKEKEKLYCWMRDFFCECDYNALYRYERYRNEDKAAHFQKIVDELREQSEAYVDGVNYLDFAWEAEQKGDYDKAVSIYRKAQKYECGPDKMLSRSIAKLYCEMGRRDLAILELEKIVNQNEQDEWGSQWDVYCCLADLLRKEERKAEAQEWACGLLRELNETKMEPREKAVWTAAADYHLFCLAENEQERVEYWERCQENYSQMKDEPRFPEEIKEFLLRVCEEMNGGKEKVQAAFSFFERIRPIYDPEAPMDFLKYILKICRETPGLEWEMVSALEKYARCILDSPSSDPKRALEFCLEGRRWYEKMQRKDEYLFSLLLRTQEECMCRLNDYDSQQVRAVRSACNYYIIAEMECKTLSWEHQVEQWHQAALNYELTENDEMKEKCLDQALKILDMQEARKIKAFFSYKAIAEEKWECCIQRGTFKESGQKVVFDYIAAAEAYFREKKIKACEEERLFYDFSRWLEDGGDGFVKGGLEKAGIQTYIAALIAGAGTDPSAAHLEEIWQEGIGEVLKSILKTVHSEEAGDRILELSGRIIPLLHDKKEFASVKELPETFSKDLQYGVIEFKKE